MKNNKLTAKYIKDIFRFMEMYNITKISIKKVSLVLENNKYNIMIFGGLEKSEWYHGNDIQELLDGFKQSKYYMMKLEV